MRQSRVLIGLLAGFLLLGIGAQGQGITKSTGSPSLQSAKVLYASKMGCALNSNRTTGGGTDDTAALQAALDTIGNAGGGTLYVDGVALTGPLQVWSNTTIQGLNNGALYKKSGTSGALIGNKHIVAGPSAPTDTNITLRNLFLNGNRTGGTGYTGSTPPLVTQLQVDINGKYLACVQMFGVTNLIMENIQIYEPACFNIWISNVNHFLIRDVTCTDVDLYDAYNQDGVHMNGYVSYGLINNLRTAVNDDSIAFNADDSYYTVGNADYGLTQPGSVPGPIDHITVDGFYPEGSISGVRVLSNKMRVDQIVIKNMVGTLQGQGLLTEPWFSGAGSGNIGSVILDGVDITILQHSSPTGFIPPTYFTIRASIESLTLRNIKRMNQQTSTYATVNVTQPQNTGLGGTTVIDQLTVDGLAIHDNNYYWDLPSQISVGAGAVVNNLSVIGANWTQTYTGLGFLIGGSGTIGSLSLSNYVGNGRILSGPSVTSQSGDAFAVPSVSSISPTQATATTSITMTGNGLAGASVTFPGGGAATPSATTATSLTVTVPAGSTPGNIIISNNYGKGSYFYAVNSSTTFEDTFVRSNRSVASDNGWVTNDGSGAFNIVNGSLDLGGNPGGTPPMMTNSTVSAANVTVSAVVYMDATLNGSIQLVFRYTSATSYYLVDFNPTGSNGITCTLYRKGAGGFTAIGSPVTLANCLYPLTNTPIKVVVNGTTFTPYVNGTALSALGDTLYTSAGLAGLRPGGTVFSHRNLFDFKVTAP